MELNFGSGLRILRFSKKLVFAISGRILKILMELIEKVWSLEYKLAENVNLSHHYESFAPMRHTIMTSRVIMA